MCPGLTSSCGLPATAKPGLGVAKTIGLLDFSSGLCAIFSSFFESMSIVKFVSPGICGSSGMFKGPLSSLSSSSSLLCVRRLLIWVLCRVGVSSMPSSAISAGGVGGRGAFIGVWPAICRFCGGTGERSLLMYDGEAGISSTLRGASSSSNATELCLCLSPPAMVGMSEDKSMDRGAHVRRSDSRRLEAGRSSCSSSAMLGNLCVEPVARGCGDVMLTPLTGDTIGDLAGLHLVSDRMLVFHVRLTYYLLLPSIASLGLQCARTTQPFRAPRSCVPKRRPHVATK